jgi:D-glycero-beta-D-manno-heptose 1-phosphate adenylyltransferase
MDSAVSTAYKLINLASLLELRQRWRADKLKLVFTNGCFDLLHPGHLHSLQGARGLGDLLVVGINSDASVRHLKGERRALIPEQGRAALIAGFSCVSYVIIFDEVTAESLVQAIQPEIYVKGGDYLPSGPEAPPEATIVNEYGGQVVILPTLPGYSTSLLIDKIRHL